MRRARPISLIVKAPSRGLVTRLPALSADLLPTNSAELQSTLLSSAAYQRASVAAQNVRYEQGVVCSAPGHARISLSSELLQGLLAYWRLQEPGGTRYDATANHYDLTDVAGTAPGVSDILSDDGVIGMAALFPPMPPWGEAQDSLQGGSALVGVFQSPLVLRMHDLVVSDSALASGFISPLTEYLPRDLFTADSSLASGSLNTTVTFTDAPDDSASLDAAAQSGTYALAVVEFNSPSDKTALDGSFASGAYALVVVFTSSPDDYATVDSALESGNYAQTVGEPQSVSDDFGLDSALLLGYYG